MDAANSIRRDCEEAVVDDVPSLAKIRGSCILITGGTGFMGTWLAEMVAFLNDSHDFNTELVLLSKYPQAFIAKAPHLAKREDIRLMECDIRNLKELPKEINYVIHAAGTPDNRLHASDPIRTMETITKGTEAILNASVGLQEMKKLLNISSGLVYGQQPLGQEAIPENSGGGPDCGSIVSVYAEAKRFAETMCSAYRSLYKMNIVTARPFAFIGPYQLLDKPWAANNFIRDGLNGGPIRILGDGETVRSYMYPSDMAFWLLRILVDGTVGLAYNVGSPHGITLQQLAEKIANNFRTKPKIFSKVGTDAQRRSRLVPDVALAQKNLGLSVKVDIDEALKRTLSWYAEAGV